MANADESETSTTTTHTTGTKSAFGAGACAAENAVVNGGHAAAPVSFGTGATAVRTGDKIAVDGGRAFENVVFDGFPE